MELQGRRTPADRGRMACGKPAYHEVLVGRRPCRQRSHPYKGNLGKYSGIRFFYKNQMLFHSPSFRQRSRLCKADDLQPNQYGNESITYMGIGSQRRNGSASSPTVQRSSRTCDSGNQQRHFVLCHADAFSLLHLRSCTRRADHRMRHEMSLSMPCVKQMGRTPPWAPGLLLRADGYECEFYKKD
jgi:DNA polymerase